MNILIVSNYYYPEIGAAPSRITNMAEGLVKEGANVTVVTCLPNYPKGKIFEGYERKLHMSEVIQGVTVFRYRTLATVKKNPWIRILGMLSFLMAVFVFSMHFWRIKRYDKVIIQSPPLLVAFLATWSLGKIFHKQIVLNVSDLWPDSAVDLGVVTRGSSVHRVMCKMESYLYHHATMCQGQSQEILDHIESFQLHKPNFLYRNLQPISFLSKEVPPDREMFKIVYAGLLGVAQDVLGIIEHIDFKSLGVELHIYGGGNQAKLIEQYVLENDRNIFYHGFLPKDEIKRVLPAYHASLVPLKVRIKGAVPSKIFDDIANGLPILYCGGGEGAKIIKENCLGFVSDPGNYEKLIDNILKLKRMDVKDYLEIRDHCLSVSQTKYSFSNQMHNYYCFLLNNPN